MTISVVGAGAAAGGTGATTLAVSPTATGNILVLYTTSQDTLTQPAAVSGGGVTTWQQGTSYYDTDTTSYLDVWAGVITATGPATITITGLSGTAFNVYYAQEYSKTDPGPWSLLLPGVPAAGSSGHALGSGLAVSWPSLTAAGAASYLYAGCGLSVFGTLNAGSTPGYTYPFTGFSSGRPAFNQSFSGTGFPTSTQTNTGAYDTIAVLVGAGTPPPATAAPQRVPDDARSRLRRLVW